VDGLVPVNDYKPGELHPEQVTVMERAKKYGAAAVFFEAGRNGRAPVAQALVFVSDGPADDPNFADVHQRLWSWGGVPLVYRQTPGLVQLFRCAHKPDFINAKGERVCSPFKILETLGAVSGEPWWDDSRLRNGTLWDDPAVCKALLEPDEAAHKGLIGAVTRLNAELNRDRILPRRLRRRLLTISLLVAYLEQRDVLPSDYFGQFLAGATRFFQVLANGEALVKLLEALENRFNGHVFMLDDTEREALRAKGQLLRFARLVEARREESGQLTLWQLYSFKDLPVELVSHVYQMFVEESDSSVYTPPFLVRLMLDEVLNPERLDRLEAREEIILDPCCGSGVFLVEAYRRLVLHWRSRNGWKKPGEVILKHLLQKVHGIDTEVGAVEVAAFSLCLALCDSLEPEAIRVSVKLFPELVGRTLHHSCFFEAREKSLVTKPVGVVVGNPPFKSSLTTEGAKRSYTRYEAVHGALPDKQLAYLFLHESAEMLAKGGALSMLQQYNFLYNQQSLAFRRTFISKWDVREVLDFISVRGLFKKGKADTKVIVVVAEAATPPKDRKILHATFRRSGRVEAEQGFDIDYYDLQWLPRRLALNEDAVWRADLLGGGRTLEFVRRVRQFRTLGEYAESQMWDRGEGFIEGRKGKRAAAKHLTGKPLLPSVALTEKGVERHRITTVKGTLFKSPYTSSRFTPPFLLVREHEDIPHCLWVDSYLTYTQQIVGFCGRKEDTPKLRSIGDWLSVAGRALKAYVALASPRLFAQKATALQADDIFSIPYPREGTLDLSANEDILVDDIVDYYRDFIRRGEDSRAMKQCPLAAIAKFTDVFGRQINAIYVKNPLRALDAQTWPGIICQPFVFGKGRADWSEASSLEGKLDAVLHKQQGKSLRVTRIARIYDGSFIFLLKPDRLRYWLRSVALRDADETLADLRAQGF